MTLSHAHNHPQKPARVVVLGAGGFLGVRLLKACAAAGIEALGLGSRDVDLAEAAAPARLVERLASRATCSCSWRRSRRTRAATPAR